MRDQQLTWGQTDGIMAVITWSPSQGKTGAEEKQRVGVGCEANHPNQEHSYDLRHRQLVSRQEQELPQKLVQVPGILPRTLMFCSDVGCQEACVWFGNSILTSIT